MTSDIFFARIAQHTGRPYERLWIEDSFGRLSRNGFTAGTRFQIANRPGLGMVLTPSILGLKVTPRRGGSLISYEARGLSDAVRASEVKVRVCVKSIVVMPCLRHFHIRAANGETWSIAGETLVTPHGQQDIVTPSPARFAATPALLEIDLTPGNVVFATEIVGNVKPGAVKLSGDAVMQVVAGQFLEAAGYSKADADTWRR